MGPDQFIPLAEGNGFISRLSHWSLKESCRRFPQADPSKPAIGLSVNVSGIQPSEPDAIRHVLSMLDRTNFNPGQLQVELTEVTLVDENLSINDVLNELRSHGIKNAIDDFGTGFPSFSYLRHFSFDVLKLDRSLISKLGSSARAQVVVGTTQHLAERLEFRIIAEGIETAQELKVLRDIGCHGGPGYVFSRPLDVANLETFNPAQADFVTAPDTAYCNGSGRDAVGAAF